MSDRVKDEQQQPRIVPVVGSSAEAHRLDSYGIGVRIDPAHTYQTETEARDVEWQNLEHFVAARGPEPTITIPPSRSSQSPDEPEVSDDLWQRVQRQQEQLKTENRNLVQRERDLRSRIFSLEEELEQFTHRAVRDQSQLESRKTQLQKDETLLAERHIAFEIQFRKFETERDTVNAQRADLERRKKAIRDEVLAELNVERAELHDAKAALQRDLDHAQVLKDALQSRFDSLAADNARTLKAEREKLWQSLTQEYEQRNTAFQQEREVWIRVRDAEKTGIEREKAMFESAVETANAEFLQGREALASELAAAREQHNVQIETEKRDWEELRLREEVALAALSETQQAEIIAARETLAGEIETLREQHLAALQAERQAWEETRERELAMVDAERAQIIALREATELQLIAAREEQDRILTEERDEWEQTYQREKALQESQHAEWLASRDAMLAASRDALEVEFISLREQHTQKLQAERDEWELEQQTEKAALEERRDEFVRERTLIENRIRFQQDHLEKSRNEFEQVQNDFRRERQVEMQRLEEANMSTIRRLKQVDLYRSSIDAREKSLDREQESFNRARKAITSTADFDRMNFQAEKHAWEQERQTQQSELRRQQEALLARTEGLESRRIRLDKLRTELEETHRATLEMRLAVEESWAQLTHTAGQDEARKRVEQVRQSLSGYYQQMHESLAEQRREQVESQSKFERQRSEFTDERQKLTAWITQRDEDLRLGEERLRIAANDAAANHTKWLTARDRWLLEKTEAEQLIRRLLSSLGENNREQSTGNEALFRLNEIQAPFENLAAHRP